MDEFYIDVTYNKTGTIRSVAFTDEDVLHYGKKGMKWGVRNRSKSEEKSRANRFGGKKKPGLAPEAANLKKLKNRPASTLNNKQLETLNKRMNLEKNYNNLKAERAGSTKFLKSIELGNKQAKLAIATVGTISSVMALANSPAGKAFISNGKKILEANKKTPSIAPFVPKPPSMN